MRVFIKTFGCRTNIYDSELIKSYLIDYEIVNSEEFADIVIINSCSVTNQADVTTRNYINKLKDKKVILTGCGIKSQGKKLFDTNKIFGAFSMSQKSQISNLLNNNSKFYSINDDDKFIDDKFVKSFDTHTKAFIKIQEGCNFNCSYCIIPQTRGRARSIDEALIIDEVKRLIDQGFVEFVLTGTNIGSYGVDRNTKLSTLLLKLINLSGIKRIRLGSIEPTQIDDEFFEVINSKVIERHLHIALQHTSETMLKIMRRRNRSFKDLELFNKLSNLGFSLGTDYIVGHPGESEEIFNEALQNFKNFPITHLHAFIYSPRMNTHSASMKIDVKGDVAKQRLKILKNITSLKNYEFRQNHKIPLNVLIEQKNGEFYEGYDQFFNKIFIKSDKNLYKKFLEIRDYEINFEANYSEF